MIDFITLCRGCTTVPTRCSTPCALGVLQRGFSQVKPYNAGLGATMNHHPCHGVSYYRPAMSKEDGASFSTSIHASPYAGTLQVTAPSPPIIGMWFALESWTKHVQRTCPYRIRAKRRSFIHLGYSTRLGQVTPIPTVSPFS